MYQEAVCIKACEACPRLYSPMPRFSFSLSSRLASWTWPWKRFCPLWSTHSHLFDVVADSCLSPCSLLSLLQSLIFSYVIFTMPSHNNYYAGPKEHVLTSPREQGMFPAHLTHSIQESFDVLVTSLQCRCTCCGISPIPTPPPSIRTSTKLCIFQNSHLVPNTQKYPLQMC